MGVCQRFDHEDVEALRVGLFGRRINTACILYRLGEIVIDTGPPNQWRKVRRFLKERAVDHVLVTHHHEDHGGNGGRIVRKFDARVMVHESGESFHRHGFRLPFYRWVAWGKPRPKYEPEILPNRIDLVDGHTLQPIHTPGHAEDHTVFLEPNRGWLFSGDLYISAKPQYLRKVEDPNQEIESLRKILQYDFETLFCAHRGVVPNGRAAVKEKLNYLISLREQVRFYQQQGDTIREIKHRLLGKEELMYWISLGDFSKRNYIEAFARSTRLEARTHQADDWYDDEQEELQNV